MGAPLRLLFLCTGNSCRSQMAEGLARWMGGERVEVYSAGTEPAGHVNPRAVAAMDELGIDIRVQTSKGLDPAIIGRVDIVITVCGHAEKRCPVVPAKVRHLHWPISDPFHATGNEEAIKHRFRIVRDELRGRIGILFAEVLAAC